MTLAEPVATFVASDGELEHALPFLEALREADPGLPLLLIPRDAQTAALAAFRKRYGFEIMQRDFADIDLLEAICFGRATGVWRCLAAFDITAPAVACLATATRTSGLGAALMRLAGETAGCVAAVSAGFVLAGPMPGTARLIRTLRENLVAYFAGRRADPLDAALPPMLPGLLGLRATAIDGAVVRRHDEVHAVDVAPLRDCTSDVELLDNGGAYRRRSGSLVDAPAPLCDSYAAECRKDWIAPPPALVGRLRNVTVHARGIVMTASGRVVGESLINTDGGAALGRLPRHPVSHRHGAGPVVLLKQHWDSNYGHWLIESLPRAGLVAECCDLAACQFLIGDDGGAMGRVYRDTLALLGITASQILPSSDETRFCAELIYPAPLTMQPWVKAPRVIRFLEELGARVPSGQAGPRRLYVSRNRVGRRALRNEAAILQRLTPLRYVVVEPQLLDFASQVRAFRDATHVIGNLGAGLANLVFAPRGVRLLALTTQFMQDDFFWDLVSQRGGTYVSLHGRASQPDAGMNSDFEIDLDALSPLLEAFERDDSPGCGVDAEAASVPKLDRT